MLGPSYFIWKQNKEWYEIYDEIETEDDYSYKIRLTDQAPPEAVESFKRYQAKMEYARKNGIIY